METATQPSGSAGTRLSQVIARGPNFVFAREFVIERHGEELWESALARLDPDTRRLWTGPLLVTGRYPFEALLEMTHALSEILGISAEEELTTMYAFIADRSLGTVHRFFLRWSQPAFVISHYDSLWKRFFEDGRVRVPEAEEGRALLCFEVPEIFLGWLPSACLGYSRKAVELAGAGELRQEETSREELGADLWRLCFALRWIE